MGIILSRDAIHHGMIEDWPVSSHDICKETTVWSKSQGDFKGKDTRRTPKEMKMEHVGLSVRIELVLHAPCLSKG